MSAALGPASASAKGAARAGVARRRAMTGVMVSCILDGFSWELRKLKVLLVELLKEILMLGRLMVVRKKDLDLKRDGR